MNENILIGIQTVNETVSVLDIEPFDFSFHSSSQKFLFRLFFGLIVAGIILTFFISFGHFFGVYARNFNIVEDFKNLLFLLTI
jgi:hypothetical protein